MITNSGSTPYSYLRRLLILPITALVLFLFSFAIAKAQTDPLRRTGTSKNKKYQDENHARLFDNYDPQGSFPNKAKVKEIIEKILQNPPTDRIYYVNRARASADKIKKLKYNMITGAEMLPPEDALKKYGETGEKGAIAFLLK